KIDLLDPAARAGVRTSDDTVPISAVTGEGVEALAACIAATLQSAARVHEIRLEAHEGKRQAWLYSHGEVIDREDLEDGSSVLHVRLSEADRARFDLIR
ncbi:MAG TPA: GTPase HflX, partial [Polymorphobacter sp.]|nr:GTPase HflX [Polymorphobacter sp.]